jgi:hypothetical protein
MRRLNSTGVFAFVIVSKLERFLVVDLGILEPG